MVIKHERKSYKEEMPMEQIGFVKRLHLCITSSEQNCFLSNKTTKVMEVK
jgi:hypothetical protein